MDVIVIDTYMDGVPNAWWAATISTYDNFLSAVRCINSAVHICIDAEHFERIEDAGGVGGVRHQVARDVAYRVDDAVGVVLASNAIADLRADMQVSIGHMPEAHDIAIGP